MTKKRPSDRINEEQVCIDSFVQHLREIDRMQEITVRDGSEPPDFWVTIEGVKYAVEVTSIVTDYNYNALCEKLVKAIRSKFETNSDINGKYALEIVRRPVISKRGTYQWNKLVSDAAAIIRDESNSPLGKEYCLLKDANGYVAMQRLSQQGSVIGLCRIMPAKRSIEVEEELLQLIQELIKAKQGRLKKVLSEGSEVILLLYDAYGYAEIEDMQKAFQNVREYEWLNSIFVATSFSDITNSLYPGSPGRRGVFLYSKNEKWLDRELKRDFVPLI